MSEKNQEKIEGGNFADKMEFSLKISALEAQFKRGDIDQEQLDKKIVELKAHYDIS